MRLAALAVVLGVLLAGCGTPAAGPSFRLSGTFTQDRTQADLDEFNGIAARYSDDVAILESFPEQFAIRGIVGGCDQLRATLQAKDYVASVGACQKEG